MAVEDAVFWQERAEQLQRALDSRVVIEQAKGVLAERFGVPPEAAFDLLRVAARSARIKVHALAEAAVTNDETPQEIVRAVARHRELIDGVPQETRMRHVEVFFRAVNDELLAREAGGVVEVVCECGNPLCTERMSVPVGKLRALRTHRNLFLVLQGHELPGIETAVDQIDGYIVVKKD